MTVTDITVTKKGRYALIVDGEFLFSVHKDIFLTTELEQGLEIEPERLEEIRQADELLSAKEKALELLSYSAHSRRQLYDKLCRHCEPEACEAAVARMVELGLLDDRSYGERLAAQLIGSRKWSLQRVRLELAKRGLESDDIEDILSAYATDQSAQALEIIRKKYSARLGDKSGVDKTIAAMLRRGFSMEDIRGALAVLADEARTDELSNV